MNVFIILSGIKNTKWRTAFIAASAMIAASVIFAGCIGKTTPVSEKEDLKPLATVSFQPPGSSPLNLTCEIARTPAEHSKGLMFREKLPVDRCMLFVFDYPDIKTFWMKNTKIPLDIIFINENRKVINVEEANVEANVSDDKLRRYSSFGPARWVVEMNRGLSASHGIGAGTSVLIETS